MKTLVLLLIPILFGCAPVPQTAGERPSSSQSLANASEPVVTEGSDTLSLIICSETTFEYTYEGGDLITEIASYLHDQGITLQIRDLLITTTSSAPLVEIKDGVLVNPIPEIIKGTELVVRGRTCPR